MDITLTHVNYRGRFNVQTFTSNAKSCKKLECFINYPKFELPPAVLKFEIEELSRQLLLAFKQNRVVIEYLDELVMLENSQEHDPRIK